MPTSGCPRLVEHLSSVLVQVNAPVSLYVALFDYTPSIMSPNSDCYEDELDFVEGQLLKVGCSVVVLAWWGGASSFSQVLSNSLPVFCHIRSARVFICIKELGIPPNRTAAVVASKFSRVRSAGRGKTSIRSATCLPRRSLQPEWNPQWRRCSDAVWVASKVAC